MSTLRVSTTQLNEIANKLIKLAEALDEQLEALKDKVATIDSNWLDENGISYVKSFDVFITNSEKINKGIGKNLFNIF